MNKREWKKREREGGWMMRIVCCCGYEDDIHKFYLHVWEYDDEAYMEHDSGVKITCPKCGNSIES